MQRTKADRVELINENGLDLLDENTIIGELFTCPIDNEPYTDPEQKGFEEERDRPHVPTLLNCGHTISHAVAVGSKVCPMCRKDITTRTANKPLLDIMHRYEQDVQMLKDNIKKQTLPSTLPARDVKIEEDPSKLKGNLSARAAQTALLETRFDLLREMLSDEEKSLLPQLAEYSFKEESYIKAMRYVFADSEPNKLRYYIRPTLNRALTLEAEVIVFKHDGTHVATLSCMPIWTKDGLTIQHTKPGHDPVTFNTIADFIQGTLQEKGEVAKLSAKKQAAEAEEKAQATPDVAEVKIEIHDKHDKQKPTEADVIPLGGDAPSPLPELPTIQEITPEQRHAKLEQRLNFARQELASRLELARVRREKHDVKSHENIDIMRIRRELKDAENRRGKNVDLPDLTDPYVEAVITHQINYQTVLERIQEFTERPPVQFYNAKLQSLLAEFSHENKCSMPQVYDAGGDCIRFETTLPGELEYFLQTKLSLSKTECFNGKEPALAVTAGFAEDIRWPGNSIRTDESGSEYKLPEATLLTATQRVYQFAQCLPRLSSQLLHNAEQHTSHEAVTLSQEGINQMQQFHAAEVISVEQSNTASGNGNRNQRTILQSKALEKLLASHTNLPKQVERNVVFVDKKALTEELSALPDKAKFNAKIIARKTWVTKKSAWGTQEDGTRTVIKEGTEAETLLVVTGHASLGKKTEEKVNKERYEAWIVDLSGSMSGGKLQYTKNALHATAKQLGDLKRGKIHVSFTGFEGVNFPCFADGDLSQASSKINSMSIGGSTPTGAALRAATLAYIKHAQGNPSIIPPCFRLYTDGDYDESVEQFSQIVDEMHAKIRSANLPLPVFRIFAIQMALHSPKAKVGFEKIANKFPGSSIIPIGQLISAEQMVSGIRLLRPQHPSVPLKAERVSYQGTEPLPIGEIEADDQTFTCVTHANIHTKQIKFSISKGQETKTTNGFSATAAVPKIAVEQPSEDDEILYGMALGREELVKKGVAMPDSLDCLARTKLSITERTRLIKQLQADAMSYRAQGAQGSKTNLAALAYFNLRLPKAERIPLFAASEEKHSPQNVLKAAQDLWLLKQLTKFDINLKDPISCSANITILQHMRSVAVLFCFQDAVDTLTDVLKSTPTLEQTLSRAHKLLTRQGLLGDDEMAAADAMASHVQFNVMAGSVNGISSGGPRTRYRWQVGSGTARVTVKEDAKAFMEKLQKENAAAHAKTVEAADEIRNLFTKVAEMKQEAVKQAEEACSQLITEQSQITAEPKQSTVDIVAPANEAFSTVDAEPSEEELSELLEKEKTQFAATDEKPDSTKSIVQLTSPLSLRIDTLLGSAALSSGSQINTQTSSIAATKLKEIINSFSDTFVGADIRIDMAAIVQVRSFARSPFWRIPLTMKGYLLDMVDTNYDKALKIVLAMQNGVGSKIEEALDEHRISSCFGALTTGRQVYNVAKSRK